MDFVYNLVVVLHLLGMAALVGGWFVVSRGAGSSEVMVWGARAQIVTGLVLVGLAEGVSSLDKHLNHPKIGVKLVVALAAVGGYLVTSRSGSSSAAKPGGDETRAAAPAPEEVATSAPTSEATAEATPDREAQAERRARRIEAIITYSLEGRRAVREGRYADAVSNRRTVLRRLRAIGGTTGRLKSAKQTLEAAMNASLQSDLAYQSGGDASGSDAEATRLKAAFARQWSAIASKYGLQHYAGGDI